MGFRKREHLVPERLRVQVSCRGKGPRAGVEAEAERIGAFLAREPQVAIV